MFSRRLFFFALFPWVILLLWPMTRPILLAGLPMSVPIWDTPFHYVYPPPALPPNLTREQALGAQLERGQVIHNPDSHTFDITQDTSWQHLLQHNADNRAVLAAYLRYGFAFYLPLASDTKAREGVDWQPLENYLSLARQGQKLEPQNAFWDWMLLYGLFHAHRVSEFETVLSGLSRKSRYHDYAQEEYHALLDYRATYDAFIGANDRIDVWEHVDSQFKMLAPDQGPQKVATDLMKLARSQKHPEKTLKLGLALAHLGQLMRLGAFSENSSLQGAQIEQCALDFDQQAPPSALSPTALLSPAQRAKMGLGPISPYTNSLSVLAKSQGEGTTSQWCLTQWNQIIRWWAASNNYLSPFDYFNDIDTGTQWAVIVGPSLLLLALMACACTRKSDDNGKRPRTFPGFCWAMFGWGLVLFAIHYSPQHYHAGLPLWFSDLEYSWSTGYPYTRFLPDFTILLGAVVATRWQQWKSNRARNSEPPILTHINWSFEPLRDLRPSALLFIRTSLVVVVIGIALLGYMMPLLNYRFQRRDALLPYWHLWDGLRNSLLTNSFVEFLVIPLLILCLLVAINRKPGAVSARREIRLRLRDYSLGAFIGGSWLVLGAFIFWMIAENGSAQQFAPLERGEFVRQRILAHGWQWE